MNITERFKTTYHGSRRGHFIEWIVIHYTGTCADALHNAAALERKLKRPRSTHYFVDATKILNVVPEGRSAWHIGSATDPDHLMRIGNADAIGIDLCEHKRNAPHLKAEDTDWFFDCETVEAAAELVACLLEKYKLPTTRLIRHYDVTHKACPRPFVGDDTNEVYGATGNELWAEFKRLVVSKLDGTKYDAKKLLQPALKKAELDR